jgi:hypothetical protein
MNPIKVLETYLEDNYGKCELNYKFGGGGYSNWTTPKGEVIAHISHDNIISIYELEKRFGAEEY